MQNDFQCIQVTHDLNSMGFKLKIFGTAHQPSYRNIMRESITLCILYYLNYFDNWKLQYTGTRGIMGIFREEPIPVMENFVLGEMSKKNMSKDKQK